jgi:hypothetical protein
VIFQSYVSLPEGKAIEWDVEWGIFNIL